MTTIIEPISDEEVTERRKKAGWALETTGMAKSGYALRKHVLAEWVAELAEEVQRLRAALDHLATPNRAIRPTGADTRAMADYTRRTLRGEL